MGVEVENRERESGLCLIKLMIADVCLIFFNMKKMEVGVRDVWMCVYSGEKVYRGGGLY